MQMKHFKIFPHIRGVNLPSSTLEWFDLHFPPSNFQGQFQVSYLSDKKFMQLWSGERDNLKLFLKEMHIFSKGNYYISANSTSNNQRKGDHLFAFHNIVIDIDCHLQNISNTHREEIIHQCYIHLKHHFTEDLLPHSIVWTGRGLQLWWKIQPAHSKCKYFYDFAKEYLIFTLQTILDKNKNLKNYIQIDTIASRNPVGLFRLPGSKNPKVNKKVIYETTGITEAYTLQNLVSKAKEDTAFQFGKGKQNPEEQSPSLDPRKTDSFASQYSETEYDLLQHSTSFTFFRYRQLLQLRLLRNRPKGCEERNNFCLLAYSALRASYNHKDALYYLTQFNQGFRQPLTETELENTIYTAKYKEGYSFSNATVIDFLQLSPEEQALIQLYPASKTKAKTSHPKRDAQRQLKKERKLAQIKELVQQQKSNVDIAKTLQLTAQTVGKYAKAFRQEYKETIIEKIRTNTLSQEEKATISKSTYYRYCKTAMA